MTPDPFTPEQEARIADIVASVIMALRCAEREHQDAIFDSSLAWALHRSGSDQSGKSDA